MPDDKGASAQETVRSYRRFNILSLDGGGVRGALEAVILERIQEDFSKFYRELDLVVGVSAGAVQALGMAAGKTPEDLRDKFVTGAKFIFADSFADDFRDMWKLTGADYSSKNMKKLLQLQFGDMRLQDLDKRVAIVAFELDNGKTEDVRTWKPKIFHNFPGPDSDGDQLVVDVAMRSAAAPTFFPTYQGYCDGAVAANNPSVVAIAQALDARAGNADLSQINLLSLGTGESERYIKGKNLDWGVGQWSSKLLYLMMEGPIRLVEFQCTQLLGERYHRLNPKLPVSIPIDAWKNIKQIVEVADELDLEDTFSWLEEHWQ